MGQGLSFVEFPLSHSDTPHSAGFLWTSDRPYTEAFTWQHKHCQETIYVQTEQYYYTCLREHGSRA